MKKLSAYIVLFAGLMLLTTACNKRKTYADHLKDEKKAIDLFISKNNLTILKDYPSSGTFKSNEFYRDPGTGVYFNIIDKGTSDSVKLNEEVYVRFSGLKYFMENDTLTYNNSDTDRSPFPETIVYKGPVNYMTRTLYQASTPAFVVPLKHLGHGGKAKMIVPFNMGSQYDVRNYQPTYYETVEYRFESQK